MGLSLGIPHPTGKASTSFLPTPPSFRKELPWLYRSVESHTLLGLSPYLNNHGLRIYSEITELAFQAGRYEFGSLQPHKSLAPPDIYLQPICSGSIYSGPGGRGGESIEEYTKFQPLTSLQARPRKLTRTRTQTTLIATPSTRSRLI